MSIFSVDDQTTWSALPFSQHTWIVHFHGQRVVTEEKLYWNYIVVIPFFRSPLCSHSLLFEAFWGYRSNCECHCELDTEWWRQCWLLPDQHCYQWKKISEHQQCQQCQQCQRSTAGRLQVQHHSTWCQLWESEGEWEWAPDNHSSRYTVHVFCMVNFKPKSPDSDKLCDSN